MFGACCQQLAHPRRSRRDGAAGAAERRCSPRCSRSASSSRCCSRSPPSAGAAGGPERGAIAGFMLGLMFDLGSRVAARVVVDHDGPRRLRRRLVRRSCGIDTTVVAGGDLRRRRRRRRRGWRCRSCGASSASRTRSSPEMSTIVPRRRVRGGDRQPRCWCRQPLVPQARPAGMEGCRPMSDQTDRDEPLPRLHGTRRLSAMAIDRRATRLGVLGPRRR